MTALHVEHALMSARWVQSQQVTSIQSTLMSAQSAELVHRSALTRQSVFPSKDEEAYLKEKYVESGYAKV